MSDQNSDHLQTEGAEIPAGKRFLFSLFQKLGKKGLFAALGGLVLLLALAVWQVQVYLEEQRVIKTESEPAALLLRDDAAKPAREPRLFVRAEYRHEDNSKERTVKSRVILRLDEEACRGYYEKEGVLNCKSSWNFLEPDVSGWSVSPALPGAWTFIPEQERYTAEFSFKYDALSPGQNYEVKIPGKLGKNVQLAPYKAGFKSSPFALDIKNWAFRVDPQNPRRCLLSGEIFSLWPFDPDSLRERLRLETQEPVQLGSPEIVFGAGSSTAVVNVEVKRLPEKSSVVTLRLEAGVKSAGGGTQTSVATGSGANVPGTDVFVSLQEVRNFISTDDELLSRQVLALEFTTPVRVREVQENTRALLLPVYGTRDDAKNKRPTRWTEYSLESRPLRSALSEGQRAELKLYPIYSPDEYSNVVSFTYSAPQGYFFLENKGGAASTSGYSLAAFRRVLAAQRLEPELRIMQEGNILSLNASKKLAIFSRALDRVDINAYRVRPQFVNFLITQTYGVLADPEFKWESSIDLQDLSESLKLSYRPKNTQGNEPDYHALDLTPLLAGGGKGIFRLELKGSVNNSAEAEDNRFLLLTDLGLNVKLAADGKRDVFVSSFARGVPLAGVKVEVIGRNGLPVFSRNSDADGKVAIPPLEGFSREKRAVAIVASLGNDFTFMGIEDHSREVSTARYPETYGRRAGSGGINAFVFSERGLFKPGEELRFGVILKSSSWDSASLKGLPVNVVLTNPRGTKIYEKQHAQNDSGILALSIPTEEDYPTGRYNLDIYLGNSHLGSAGAQLEEFQPDNLRVNASFKNVPAAELRQGWLLPRDLHALVRVENLYGTAAAGNRVSAALTLTPLAMRFERYKEYRFFDPGASTQSYTAELSSADTNAEGEAEFDLGLDRYSSGTYRLNIDIQAFEKGGGRGVSSALQALISPLENIVGWKSEARLNFVALDSRADVSFIAVDNSLNPTELLDLELVISEVEYVASLVRDNSGSYRYDKVRRLKPVEKSSVGVGREGLTFTLPTGATGEFELSLLDSRGQIRCNLNYVVAGGSQRRFGLERDATLRVHLDKTEYRAGEDISVFVSAPYPGAGLITLESDRVLSHRWFTADTSDSVQRIAVPDDFEGRGFVSVSLARDIRSDAVYSTPYSYALAPFVANIDRRDLKLFLTAQSLIQPGETLNMRLRAETPGKAIVFAVNEGILQMSAYLTPSPLTFFLKQNPLSVVTMQNWDLLMPEFNLMNPSVFGGGFAEMALRAATAQSNLNPFRRKSEPSVVYWSGLVDVGPEERELSWEVPVYFNGGLRLMAVASGLSAVGESSGSATVRAPLIITPDLPVAVAPGDEFEVSAVVANNVEDSAEGLDIALRVELDSGLEFLRRPEESLKVEEGREGKAVFRLKATERLGEAVVRITASASFRGREITASRPVSLSVRPASPRVSTFKAGFVKGREQVVPVGRSLFPQYAEVEASLSGLPLPMLDALSSFLTRFPHGCTEQILSAAFPYAILNKNRELLPLPRGMNAAQLRERSEKAVEKGLIALQERQVYPGRFSLWPYGGRATPFLTTYGLDYLLSAREAGYRVDEELFRNARQENLALLQSLPRGPDALRAVSYAAWVHVRSGQSFTGLPQLVKHLDAGFRDWRKEPAAALLAACYQMMQQTGEADNLIREVKADDGKKNYQGWFYSRLWDNSLLLSVLARHFPERLENLEGRKALVQVINDVSGNAYSTPGAVQAVRALADYAGAHLESKPGLELSARDAAGKALPIPAEGELVKRLSLGGEAAEFRFAGAEGLYWQISADGFDLKPQPVQPRKIIVKASYLPAGGKKLSELAQGDEVYVLLTASAAERIDNVAITSLIPGGFEMVIAKGGRIVGGGDSGEGRGGAGDAGEYSWDEDEEYSEEEEYAEEESSWDLESVEAVPNPARIQETRAMLAEAGLSGSPLALVHVERREDRMVAYASLDSQDRVFIYKIKAINKGRFTLPGVFAEALYDPDARAGTGAGVVEIK
ncbi:MAG: hypothetical protein LBQ63_05540 [Deltaproteobacteria bacterium]|jgi:uncharacterized protein YfaS (alpha-2-macroglobulin family)|nr:hypothetical protein [Deltaproteobacteria bacterium]